MIPATKALLKDSCSVGGIVILRGKTSSYKISETMRPSFFFTVLILCLAGLHAACNNPGPAVPLDIQHSVSLYVKAGGISIIQQDELPSVQPDTLAKYTLLISHIKRDAKRYIAIRKKIRVWAYNLPVITGRLDSVAHDSILVGNQWLNIRDIGKLRVHTPETTIPGILVTGLGAFLTTGGILLIIGGIDLLNTPDDEGFLRLFSVIFGLFALSAGIITTPAGLATAGSGVLILVLGKNYNFHKKWRISTVR